MIILTILLLAALILIAYYDFKFMAVPLVLLILTVLLSFLRLMLFNRVDKGLMYAELNLCGCLVIILMSFIVMFVVTLKLFNPLNVLLGVGDLLFFPAVCFTFSPVNFVLFFVLSLATILLFKPFTRMKSNFPLAGGISALMFFTILAGLIIPADLYNDVYILNLLSKG
jgi:hypothetical protein